uniref:Uncharacterized protein n=1 Tax=uncultured marine virus TaxID=186617 RepID=A0A0F7L469_9VIRU|nr:hypothetical protein [uncultured marine virus]
MALVKYNNNSISTISSAGQLAQGSLVPIKTLTASSSSTLSFVHGTDGVVLDSTYPIYKFEFINIHPSTASRPQFNLSTDGGSNYNVTKTTTAFTSYHDEADTGANLSYAPSADLAQSTGVQRLGGTTDADNDTAMSGTLTLFNPSSTTFVKHFIIRTQQVSTAYSQELYIAGYGNTTSAINGIQFSQSSGTIETGKIKLYGIKDS